MDTVSGIVLRMRRSTASKVHGCPCFYSMKDLTVQGLSMDNCHGAKNSSKNNPTTKTKKKLWKPTNRKLSWSTLRSRNSFEKQKNKNKKRKKENVRQENDEREERKQVIFPWNFYAPFRKVTWNFTGHILVHESTMRNSTMPFFNFCFVEKISETELTARVLSLFGWLVFCMSAIVLQCQALPKDAKNRHTRSLEGLDNQCPTGRRLLPCTTGWSTYARKFFFFFFFLNSGKREVGEVNVGRCSGKFLQHFAKVRNYVVGRLWSRSSVAAGFLKKKKVIKFWLDFFVLF